MTLSVSSAFDGGNIKLVAIDGDRVDLEIVKDHMSDFYQWFYFRLTGGLDRTLELRITNCARRRLSGRLGRLSGLPVRGSRELGAGRDRLCGRRPQHPRHAGVGQHLDRLFRALHDGTAPRFRRRGRRRAGRRLPHARANARRARDRLFQARRRAPPGLALRPPASGRDHGRALDGRRDRAAAGRIGSGDAAPRARRRPSTSSPI